MEEKELKVIKDLWINNLNKKVNSEGLSNYLDGYSDALEDLIYNLGINEKLKELD